MIPEYRHLRQIPRGRRGTLDKCREELEELEDAAIQNNRWHSVIEAADLINSTYTFIWQRFGVPWPVVILIALMTAVYKPAVRWLRSFKSR